MDLSRFKWPIIIVVVVGVLWLLSAPGVNFMFDKFTSDEPGTDAKKDAFNEGGLSKLAGYLLMTFRYEKAEEVLEAATLRYPDGENYHFNMFQLARCAEKRDDYQTSVQILEDLMAIDANTIEPRIPPNDELRLRTDKMIEMNQL